MTGSFYRRMNRSEKSRVQLAFDLVESSFGGSCHSFNRIPNEPFRYARRFAGLHEMPPLYAGNPVGVVCPYRRHKLLLHALRRSAKRESAPSAESPGPRKGHRCLFGRSRSSTLPAAAPGYLRSGKQTAPDSSPPAAAGASGHPSSTARRSITSAVVPPKVAISAWLTGRPNAAVSLRQSRRFGRRPCVRTGLKLDHLDGYNVLGFLCRPMSNCSISSSSILSPLGRKGRPCCWIPSARSVHGWNVADWPCGQDHADCGTGGRRPGQIVSPYAGHWRA